MRNGWETISSLTETCNKRILFSLCSIIRINSEKSKRKLKKNTNVFVNIFMNNMFFDYFTTILLGVILGVGSIMYFKN